MYIYRNIFMIKSLFVFVLDVLHYLFHFFYEIDSGIFFQKQSKYTNYKETSMCMTYVHCTPLAEVSGVQKKNDSRIISYKW